MVAPIDEENKGGRKIVGKRGSKSLARRSPRGEKTTRLGRELVFDNEDCRHSLATDQGISVQSRGSGGLGGVGSREPGRIKGMKSPVCFFFRLLISHPHLPSLYFSRTFPYLFTYSIRLSH